MGLLGRMGRGLAIPRNADETPPVPDVPRLGLALRPRAGAGYAGRVRAEGDIYRAFVIRSLDHEKPPRVSSSSSGPTTGGRSSRRALLPTAPTTTPPETTRIPSPWFVVMSANDLAKPVLGAGYRGVPQPPPSALGYIINANSDLGRPCTTTARARRGADLFSEAASTFPSSSIAIDPTVPGSTAKIDIAPGEVAPWM